MRLLFWLILIGLVFFALRSKLRGFLQDNQPQEFKPPVDPGATSAANPATPNAALENGESMLACAHCAVYFPASEAVRVKNGDAGGQELIFCCEAHRQQHCAPHLKP